MPHWYDCSKVLISIELRITVDHRCPALTWTIIRKTAAIVYIVSTVRSRSAKFTCGQSHRSRFLDICVKNSTLWTCAIVSSFVIVG